MKKIFQLLLSAFILLLASTCANAQKNNEHLVAVAFYNVENLFHPSDDPNKYDEEFTPTGANKYTEEIYRKKLDNLSRVLSQIAIDKVPTGPAIIGVSEIENIDVLRDLAATARLRPRGYKAICIEGPDARGIDVGMLYNPKEFKVIEAKSHLVELNRNGRKERTRDILQVTGLLLGDTVDILVGHWPSRRGGEAASQWKREAAAQVCRRIKDEIVAKNPHARVIIMGDLNDDPVSPSVAKTLDAKGKEKDVVPGGLYNPFYRYFKRGQGTLGYNDSWNLFDQIIVSSGFIQGQDKSWKFRDAFIFKKNFMINQFGQYKGYPHRSYVGSTWMDGYSDHFPTYILISKTK